VLSLENTPPKSVVVVCLLDHPFLKSLRHKRRRRRRRTFFFVSKSNVKVVENNTTHMRKN